MMRFEIGASFSYIKLAAFSVIYSLATHANDLDDHSQVVKRGEYLAQISGCISCHTNESSSDPLAGGKRFLTPFGEFVTPNISSSEKFGIGAWSYEQFEQALRKGTAPNGQYYFPVFPFVSYSGMKAADVSAIWAYLMSTPAIEQHAGAHNTDWFVSRQTLIFWRWTQMEGDEANNEVNNDSLIEKDKRLTLSEVPSVEHGVYLMDHVLHCQECHTPRNRLGGLKHEEYFAGATLPSGNQAPNIQSSQFNDWKHSDIAFYLEIGENPQGDYAGGEMAEVIDAMTSALTKLDRDSVVLALKHETKTSDESSSSTKKP